MIRVCYCMVILNAQCYNKWTDAFLIMQYKLFECWESGQSFVHIIMLCAGTLTDHKHVILQMRRCIYIYIYDGKIVFYSGRLTWGHVTNGNSSETFTCRVSGHFGSKFILFFLIYIQCTICFPFLVKHETHQKDSQAVYVHYLMLSSLLVVPNWVMFSIAVNSKKTFPWIVMKQKFSVGTPRTKCKKRSIRRYCFEFSS